MMTERGPGAAQLLPKTLGGQSCNSDTGEKKHIRPPFIVRCSSKWGSCKNKLILRGDKIKFNFYQFPSSSSRGSCRC